MKQRRNILFFILLCSFLSSINCAFGLTEQENQLANKLIAILEANMPLDPAEQYRSSYSTPFINELRYINLLENTKSIGEILKVIQLAEDNDDLHYLYIQFTIHIIRLLPQLWERLIEVNILEIQNICAEMRRAQTSQKIGQATAKCHLPATPRPFPTLSQPTDNSPVDIIREPEPHTHAWDRCNPTLNNDISCFSGRRRL